MTRNQRRFSTFVHTSMIPAVRERQSRLSDARALGYTEAMRPSPRQPFVRGTPEYVAYQQGADAAAFDARHMWAA